MNTPTHILLSAACFSKHGEGNKARNWAAIIGGIAPDLPIYVMWIWSKIVGYSEEYVWNTLYYSKFWQSIDAVFNSAPICIAIIALGWLRNKVVLWVFGASALLHLVLDFPVHQEDAHAHFWPLSDYKFHSPFSYWNEDGYSNVISVLEIALTLGLIVMLWRRFPEAWVRIWLAAPLILFAAVSTYYWILFG